MKRIYFIPRSLADALWVLVGFLTGIILGLCILYTSANL